MTRQLDARSCSGRAQEQIKVTMPSAPNFGPAIGRQQAKTSLRADARASHAHHLPPHHYSTFPHTHTRTHISCTPHISLITTALQNRASVVVPIHPSPVSRAFFQGARAACSPPDATSITVRPVVEACFKPTFNPPHTATLSRMSVHQHVLLSGPGYRDFP
jgi:hypothetical protein